MGISWQYTPTYYPHDFEPWSDTDTTRCGWSKYPNGLVCGFGRADHPERKAASVGDDKQVGGDHYQTGGVQPIDLITDLGVLLPFVQGSIIKYAARLRRKEVPGKTWQVQTIEDLRKIQHYAEILIKHLEK